MKPTIDFAAFEKRMANTGLTLTPEQVRAIYDGYGALQAMLERVNKPLPREAEPALQFDPENV